MMSFAVIFAEYLFRFQRKGIEAMIFKTFKVCKISFGWCVFLLMQFFQALLLFERQALGDP
jgi:hypothetical protein